MRKKERDGETNIGRDYIILVLFFLVPNHRKVRCYYRLMFRQVGHCRTPRHKSYVKIMELNGTFFN